MQPSRILVFCFVALVVLAATATGDYLGGYPQTNAGEPQENAPAVTADRYVPLRFERQYLFAIGEQDGESDPLASLGVWLRVPAGYTTGTTCSLKIIEGCYSGDPADGKRDLAHSGGLAFDTPAAFEASAAVVGGSSGWVNFTLTTPHQFGQGTCGASLNQINFALVLCGTLETDKAYGAVEVRASRNTDVNTRYAGLYRRLGETVRLYRPNHRAVFYQAFSAEAGPTCTVTDAGEEGTPECCPNAQVFNGEESSFCCAAATDSYGEEGLVVISDECCATSNANSDNSACCVAFAQDPLPALFESFETVDALQEPGNTFSTSCCPNTFVQSSPSGDTYCCLGDADEYSAVTATESEDASTGACCPDTSILEISPSQRYCCAVSWTGQSERPSTEELQWASTDEVCCAPSQIFEDICCPEASINDDLTACCRDIDSPAGFTSWVATTTTESDTYEATCCPDNYVQTTFESADTVCCPGVNSEYLPTQDSESGDVRTCCPAYQVLEDGLNTYCCDTTWSSTEDAPTSPDIVFTSDKVCCSSANVVTNGGLTSCGCGEIEEPVIIGGLCCAGADANNDNSACCSSFTEPENGFGSWQRTIESFGQVYTDSCCPNNYVQEIESGRYCCAGDASEFQAVTDSESGTTEDNACCPVDNVVTVAGEGSYCCLEDVSEGGYTWTGTQCCLESRTYEDENPLTGTQCCPETSEVTDDGEGTRFCCAGNAEVSYTIDGEPQTNTNCCPVANVVTVTGEGSYCCLEDVSEGGYTWTGTQCCLESRTYEDEDPLTGTQCCPETSEVTDDGEGTRFCCAGNAEVSYTIDGEPQTNTNCCPVANVVTVTGEGSYCCSEDVSEGGYTWTGTECCLTTQTVSDGLGGLVCCGSEFVDPSYIDGACCSEDEINDLGSACCSAFTEIDSATWVVTDETFADDYTTACCPSTYVSTPPGSLDDYCCNGPSSEYVGVSDSESDTDEGAACCPSDLVLQDTLNYCCDVLDRVEQDAPLTTDNFRWAPREEDTSLNSCCPIAQFSESPLGTLCCTAETGPFVYTQNEVCCPVTRSVAPEQDSPFCCDFEIDLSLDYSLLPSATPPAPGEEDLRYCCATAQVAADGASCCPVPANEITGTTATSYSPVAFTDLPLSNSDRYFYNGADTNVSPVCCPNTLTNIIGGAASSNRACCTSSGYRYVNLVDQAVTDPALRIEYKYCCPPSNTISSSPNFYCCATAAVAGAPARTWNAATQRCSA